MNVLPVLSKMISHGQLNYINYINPFTSEYNDDISFLNFLWRAKPIFDGLSAVHVQAVNWASAHWWIFALSSAVTAVTVGSVYVYNWHCLQKHQFYKIPKDHTINEILLKANEVSPPKSLEELRSRTLVEAQKRIEYMDNERLTLDINLLHKSAPDYSAFYQQIQENDNVKIVMRGYNPEQLSVLRDVVVTNRKILHDLEGTYGSLQNLKNFIHTTPESSAKKDLVNFCFSLDERFMRMRRFISEFSAIDTDYINRKFYTDYLLRVEADKADISHLSVLARFKVAFQHYIFELKRTTSVWNSYSERLAYKKDCAVNIKGLHVDNWEQWRVINDLFAHCDNTSNLTNDLVVTYISISYKYWPQIDQFMTITSALEQTNITFKSYEALSNSLPRMLPAWDSVKQDPAKDDMYIPQVFNLMDETLIVVKNITPNVLHYTNPSQGPHILYLSNLQANTLQLHDYMRFMAGHQTSMYKPNALQLKNHYYYHTITNGMDPARYIADHPQQEALIRAIDSPHNWAFHRAFIHPMATEISFNNKGRWTENFLVCANQNALNTTTLMSDTMSSLSKYILTLTRPRSPYTHPLSTPEWSRLQQPYCHEFPRFPSPEVLPEHRVLLNQNPWAATKPFSYAEWVIHHPMNLHMSRMPVQTITDQAKVQMLADWALNPTTSYHIESVSQFATIVTCY